MFFKKSELNEETILKALSKVKDPDLNRDIVSLGFVKNLKLKSGMVEVDIELTTPACPVKDELKKQCEENIQALNGVTRVQVNMTSNVRKSTPEGQRVSLPQVKNVIAVASGKGGVGKSTVSVNLAVALSQLGAKVGLLDADIYGPSIPLMMGIKNKPKFSQDEKLRPIESHGIKMMSMGFLIPDDQAVVWRGPMVHGALMQFLTQVDWGDLDYLLIDMPPGTGDAQLSIAQNAPLSGAIIVTTPQEVSLLDARRGLIMFENVKVPILGIIENMSNFVCPHCRESSPIFSSGGGKAFSEVKNVPLLGTIPIDPNVTLSGDSGVPVMIQHPQSSVSVAFRKAAQEMAATLSIQNAKTEGLFKPLKLEWNAENFLQT